MENISDEPADNETPGSEQAANSIYQVGTGVGGFVSKPEEGSEGMPWTPKYPKRLDWASGGHWHAPYGPRR